MTRSATAPATRGTQRSAPRPLGRRERAKADKRARILAAARDRLTRQGYDGMTMAQVAEDADVAMGTVFQYAATKAELLMMVTADRWANAIPAVIAEVGDDAEPGVLVLRLLAPLMEASAAEPELTAVVARELLFGAEGPHRSEVAALVNDLENAIRAAVEAPGKAERAAAAARLIISGGLVELNRTRTGVAPATTVRQRVQLLVEIALDGVRAR